MLFGSCQLLWHCKNLACSSLIINMKVKSPDLLSRWFLFFSVIFSQSTTPKAQSTLWQTCHPAKQRPTALSHGTSTPSSRHAAPTSRRSHRTVSVSMLHLHGCNSTSISTEPSLYSACHTKRRSHNFTLFMSWIFSRNILLKLLLNSWDLAKSFIYTYTHSKTLYYSCIVYSFLNWQIFYIFTGCNVVSSVFSFIL